MNKRIFVRKGVNERDRGDELYFTLTTNFLGFVKDCDKVTNCSRSVSKSHTSWSASNNSDMQPFARRNRIRFNRYFCLMAST